MKVTAKMLRSKDACTRDVEIFEREWPKGAQTTLKNLKRAVELDLDMDFFVDLFLTNKQRKEYFKLDKDASYEDGFSERTAQALFDVLKRKK